MNKTTKYRGYSEELKSFVYGFYQEVDVEGTVYSYIFWQGEVISVVPESVGQFTGLLDKNGKEVYEGDYDKDFQVVRWCERRNGWSMSIYDFPTKEHICCHCYSCEGNYEISEVIDEIEIVGNIYENAK